MLLNRLRSCNRWRPRPHHDGSYLRGAETRRGGKERSTARAPRVAGTIRRRGAAARPSRKAARPSRKAARPSRTAARPSRTAARPSRKAARPSRTAARPSRTAAKLSDLCIYEHLREAVADGRFPGVQKPAEMGFASTRKTFAEAREGFDSVPHGSRRCRSTSLGSPRVHGTTFRRFVSAVPRFGGSCPPCHVSTVRVHGTTFRRFVSTGPRFDGSCPRDHVSMARVRPGTLRDSLRTKPISKKMSRRVDCTQLATGSGR